jgi:hypothetical protein
MRMFDEQTVFILGAGASWHYGYPTGEDLVKKVIEKSKVAEQFFDHSIRAQNDLAPTFLKDIMKNKNQPTVRAAWKRALDEVKKLRLGLEQVNPLVIDYYLGQNPELKGIGRLLIAWVILECEDKSRNRYNPNRQVAGRDDWVRFLIHELAINCRQSSDLLLNRVNFITFNYDVSLEYALKNGLAHIQLFNKEDRDQFLGGYRINHIYGRIRDGDAAARWSMKVLDELDPGNLTEHSAPKYQAGMKEGLDLVYEASKGLRVIDPDDKGTNDEALTAARTAIHDAQRIFILGYGFDEHNSERLELNKCLRHNRRPGFASVAYTNYEDRGQINKHASKVFYGGIEPQMLTSGHQRHDRYEKSIRNTYDALAWDFDLTN